MLIFALRRWRALEVINTRKACIDRPHAMSPAFAGFFVVKVIGWDEVQGVGDSHDRAPDGKGNEIIDYC